MQGRQIYRALTASTHTHTDISQDVVHPLPPGFRLIRVDGRTAGDRGYELALLDDDSKDVAYYIALSAVTISAACPEAVAGQAYRSTYHLHRAAASGLTRHIIDYALQQHVVILSDGNQSAGGPFTWESQISAALSTGAHAYLYTDERIKEIVGQEALQELISQTWLTTPIRSTIILLSNSELPLNANYRIPPGFIEHLDDLDAQAPFAAPRAV